MRKLLKIQNWDDTTNDIINWTYHNGYRIYRTTDHSPVYGGQYIFHFEKGGYEKLAIAISRGAGADDKHTIRGKTLNGKYSNIYRVTKEQFKHTGHVKYVFNKIIDQLGL